jgi:hypothetical protein
VHLAPGGKFAARPVSHHFPRTIQRGISSWQFVTPSSIIIYGDSQLYSWLVGEGEAFTQGHQDMGSILVMAQDFLDKHKKLNAQLKVNNADL